MSNYTKSTNFATKDALASGNPLKIVKGTEIDTEFNNIATAIATKADLASPTFTGTPAAPTASFGTSTTQLATTAFVQAALQALHPVGSIYINATNSTNPGTLLGFGTWTAFGAGRVPVGFNASDTDFDTAEETGGAKTVSSSGTISGTVGGTSLTEAQMPKHYHLMLGPNSVSSPQGSGSSSGVYGGGTPDDSTQAYGTYSTGGNASSGSQTTGTSNGDSHTHSFSGTYSGSATSVLQPYITVYMWKRTA
jgi:hypothetical protein